jgi:integrase
MTYLIKESKKMTGKIRTSQRCPNCGSKFSYLEQVGYICVSCKTVPDRYFIDFFDCGKRQKVYVDNHGIPIDSFRRAQDMLNLIRKRIEDRKFDDREFKISELQKYQFANVANLWLDNKVQEKKSPSYFRDCKRHKKLFVSYFHYTDIRDIKSVDILNFRNSLKYSINNRMVALKNIFTFAFKLEMIDKIPSFPQNKTTEQTERKWISSETQIEILSHIPYEHKEIFRFLFLHGTRIGECRALKNKDVNIEEMTVTIRRTFSFNQIWETTKQHKINIIPLHPEMLPYIIRMKHNSLPEAFLFTHRGEPYKEWTLQKIWRTVCKQVGIQNIKLYNAARHSYASQLLNNGIPIEIIGRLLGHSKIQTTMIYSHLSTKSLQSATSKITLIVRDVSISEK